MATFVYKAKKTNAETVTGQITAHSEDEAIDLINQLGLLPVSVDVQSSEEMFQDASKGKKVKTKEIFIFSRQLSNLMKSGVPLLKGLSIIEDQTTNPYFKKVVSHIRWGIKNGKSFSECLSVYPNIFSSLYIVMVRAGEEGGNLEEIIVSVAKYQQQQEEILSKVRMALAYPILMAVVGIGTIYFTLSYVLPKMMGIFDNLDGILPLPTRILLSISQVLSQGWPIILIAILSIIIAFRRWMQSTSGRIVMSKVMLSLPLFGQIILKIELSRFCRTLDLLLRSSVPIIKALEVTIPILSNALIKAQLIKCKEDLSSGGLFGDSLRDSKEIPAMMGHMISVGEESGNLNEVLHEIAETYEQETNEKTKIITTLLEPIMILCVGLIVGFIVFAMLLPIFQIDILAR